MSDLLRKDCIVINSSLIKMKNLEDSGENDEKGH